MRGLPTAALVVLAGASLAFVAVAALAPPQLFGDGLEYQLMAESWLDHASPDLRAEDVAALRDRMLRFGAATPLSLRFEIDAPRWIEIGYLPSGDGRRYCYHFWAYSLLSVPLKAALRAVGGNELKALPVLNAILLVVGLLGIASMSTWTSSRRILLGALVLSSPVVFFLRWPESEIFSFTLALLALTFVSRKAHGRAVLCAAAASLQNPPLVFLVAAVWFGGVIDAALEGTPGDATRRRPWPRVAVLTAAALPGLLAPAFYFLKFGRPSLIPVAVENMSARRVLELLFDLNIGLLPYVPLALVLFLAVVGGDLRHRRFSEALRLAGGLLLMMIACTPVGNWNHGSPGPSRYTVWMLPIVFYVVAERAPLKAAALAAAIQLAITLSHPGLFGATSYLHHSAAARFVLDHCPACYNPTFEIFTERTTGKDLNGLTTEPFVYGEGARCRKALVQRRPGHEAQLRERCGFVPESAARWFASAREGERSQWGYVDY